MAYTNYRRPKNADTPENEQRYYLSNKTLLPEVIKAKAAGRVSNELAKMLMLLTRKYAQRPCFASYTYKEDMISEALANLCQNALKFNPEKGSNPFAFYSTCINNSFLQFLNVEKKHRKIRDQLLIDMGENPSYNFVGEHKAQNVEGGEFRAELNDLKSAIEEAHQNVKRDAEWAAEKAAKLEAETAKMLESGAADDVPEIDADEFFSEDETTKPQSPSPLLDFED